MMHGDRSRGPPPYHPGWGGLARKLVLEENTVQMYGLALAPLMLQLECSLQVSAQQRRSYRGRGFRLFHSRALSFASYQSPIYAGL